MQLGYTCSSEEFEASDLVRFATMAEDAGFSFVTVSDHFHPWTTSQGHSPFAWSTLGAIAARTRSVRMGTGIIRELWTGETVDHHGAHYTVENAKLFSASPHPIDIVWAAGGPASARYAAKHADGMWATSPSADTAQAYRDAGGDGVMIGQLTICWGPAERAARTAFEIWPNAAEQGQLSQDLPTWSHFEQAARMVTSDDVAKSVVVGDDVDAVVERIGHSQTLASPISISIRWALTRPCSSMRGARNCTRRSPSGWAPAPLPGSDELESPTCHLPPATRRDHSDSPTLRRGASVMCA